MRYDQNPYLDDSPHYVLYSSWRNPLALVVRVQQWYVYYFNDYFWEQNLIDQNIYKKFNIQLKGSGQNRPNWHFAFFYLCSKVADFLHVTKHY